MKQSFADQIAADMNKTLNSEEHKKLFSTASMIQKVAFNRVADEGKLVSETEKELEKQGILLKIAGETNVVEPVVSTLNGLVSQIIRISEALETAGFEKLAGDTAVLAGCLIAEAKEKSSGKSSDKKKDSKKSKMTMKERMEKMRKMQKGKGKGKGKSKSKDSKKSEPAKSSKKEPSKSESKSDDKSKSSGK